MKYIDKLPDHWCVKPKNEEEAQKLAGYFGGLYGDMYYLQYQSLTPYLEYYWHNIVGGVWGEYIDKGYTEISFKDFERLVLKEIREPLYEIY